MSKILQCLTFLSRADFFLFDWSRKIFPDLGSIGIQAHPVLMYMLLVQVLVFFWSTRDVKVASIGDSSWVHLPPDLPPQSLQWRHSISKKLYGMRPTLVLFLTTNGQLCGFCSSFRPSWAIFFNESSLRKRFEVAFCFLCAHTVNKRNIETSSKETCCHQHSPGAMVMLITKSPKTNAANV